MEPMVEAFFATCTDYELDLFCLELVRLNYEFKHWPDMNAIRKFDAYCRYLANEIAEKYRP